MRSAPSLFLACKPKNLDVSISWGSFCCLARRRLPIKGDTSLCAAIVLDAIMRPREWLTQLIKAFTALRHIANETPLLHYHSNMVEFKFGEESEARDFGEIWVWPSAGTGREIVSVGAEKQRQRFA